MEYIRENTHVFLSFLVVIIVFLAVFIAPPGHITAAPEHKSSAKSGQIHHKSAPKLNVGCGG